VLIIDGGYNRELKESKYHVGTIFIVQIYDILLYLYFANTGY